MKMTLNFSQFLDNWPTDHKDQFSYEGKKALFDYFEHYEEETGEQIEFDPIALCCKYTEYDNLKELQADYSDIESMEDLENNTAVIKVFNDGTPSDKFIIQQF